MTHLVPRVKPALLDRSTKARARYVALLAELRPERAPAAAIRWHGRLESSYALVALAALGQGDTTAHDVLRSLLRKVRPTMLPRVS